MRINPVSFNITRRNIAFRKNMKELVYPFGRDLVCCCTDSERMSVEAVNRIVQKYSPETKVDSIGNYKEQDIRNPKALFNMQLEAVTNSQDGEISVFPAQKIVYIGIDDYCDLKAGAFLAEVLHEATHVFQQEADDRMSYKELYEIYLNNSSDVAKTKHTLRIMDTIFVQLETVMNRAYDLCLKNNSKRLKDRNKEFQQEFSMDVDEFVISALDFLVSKISDDDVDYGLLYDYFILRARNEEEAYRNMINFKPQLIDKNSQVGLQIEMYDKMASALAKNRKSVCVS